MKFLISSAIGLLAIASMAVAIDPNEAKEMFRGMSQECKDSEKATDDDVEKMINEQYPESKEGKCLVACMQGKVNFIKEKIFEKLSETFQ
jgi:hypothetical protein